MKEDQPFDRVNQRLSVKRILFNNFIGGISWALGATVGISLLFTLLGLLAQNINLVPIVGSFVSDIINFIMATNPNLK